MKVTAIIAFALACSTNGQCGVIYDSFGPNDSFAASSSDPLGSGAYTLLAVPFTPLVPATLDSVTVGMRYLSGDNMVRLTVRPDDEGVPGNVVLDTIEAAGFRTDEGSVRTGQSQLHPLLDAGASYWVVAQPIAAEDSFAWHLATTASFGRAYQIADQAVWLADGERTYALRVEGTVGTGIRPRLSVTVQGANTVLTWPRAFPDYILEATDNLAPGSMWHPVNAAPVSLGSEQSVTVPASTTATFYRLKRQ